MTYDLPDLELSAIQAIAREWANITTNLPPNKLGACILAARTATETLNELNIRNEAVPIAAVVENDAMRATHMTGVLNDDAWNVCCGKFSNIVQDDEEGAWQGHIVILTENYFVDLTATQFARPAKNIYIPRSIIVPTSDIKTVSIPFYKETTTWAKWFAFTLPSGRGRYLFRPQYENTDYMNGRDWKTGHERFNITEGVKTRLASDRMFHNITNVG